MANTSSSRVIPLSIGDHDVMGCLHKISCKNFAPRSILCRAYSKYDPEILCIYIKNPNTNVTDQFENVNKAWDHFHATLLDIFNKHTPIKEKKMKGKASP